MNSAVLLKIWALAESPPDVCARVRRPPASFITLNLNTSKLYGFDKVEDLLRRVSLIIVDKKHTSLDCIQINFGCICSSQTNSF